MKIFILFTFLFLLIFGSKNEIVSVDNSIKPIRLSIDKLSYTELDSIYLSLENKSVLDIIIGLRCGVYLETSHQIKENNHWSDSKKFWYEGLECPIFLDTIQAKRIFAYSIPSGIFDSTGTFRLLTPYYVSSKDTSMVVISNSFEIR